MDNLVKRHTVPPTVLSKNCKNLHIDQTTSHMLKEVPQVEKSKKFRDPPMAFRDMAANIKG